MKKTLRKKYSNGLSRRRNLNKNQTKELAQVQARFQTLRLNAISCFTFKHTFYLTVHMKLAWFNRLTYTTCSKQDGYIQLT